MDYLIIFYSEAEKKYIITNAKNTDEIKKIMSIYLI